MGHRIVKNACLYLLHIIILEEPLHSPHAVKSRLCFMLDSFHVIVDYATSLGCLSKVPSAQIRPTCASQLRGFSVLGLFRRFFWNKQCQTYNTGTSNIACIRSLNVWKAAFLWKVDVSIWFSWDLGSDSRVILHYVSAAHLPLNDVLSSNSSRKKTRVQ